MRSADPRSEIAILIRALDQMREFLEPGNSPVSQGVDTDELHSHFPTVLARHVDHVNVGDPVSLGDHGGEIERDGFEISPESGEVSLEFHSVEDCTIDDLNKVVGKIALDDLGSGIGLTHGVEHLLQKGLGLVSGHLPASYLPFLTATGAMIELVNAITFSLVVLVAATAYQINLCVARGLWS